MQTYCNLHDICRRTMHFADWSIGLPLPYNSPDKHTGGMTYGGHSDSIVVDEAFVLRIPTNIDLSAAAPLLCAGITTYSPLLHYKVGKGQRVGIVGLSGLGHMGVKLAKAFGAHVVVVTTSPNKAQDPLAPRCHEVVISKNQEEMKKRLNSFHFILDTVSAKPVAQGLERLSMPPTGAAMIKPGV